MGSNVVVDEPEDWKVVEKQVGACSHTGLKSVAWHEIRR